MSQKRVLIVDDEPDIVSFLTTLLTDNGYATSAASDGETGWEMVAKHRPDLITLDLVMPNESGVKLLRRLSRDDTYRTIPVVIVSGLNEFRTFIAKCGPVPEPAAFVDKPIQPTVILQAIQRALS